MGPGKLGWASSFCVLSAVCSWQRHGFQMLNVRFLILIFLIYRTMTILLSLWWYCKVKEEGGQERPRSPCATAEFFHPFPSAYATVKILSQAVLGTHFLKASHATLKNPAVIILKNYIPQLWYQQCQVLNLCWQHSWEPFGCRVVSVPEKTAISSLLCENY